MLARSVNSAGPSTFATAGRTHRSPARQGNARWLLVHLPAKSLLQHIVGLGQLHSKAPLSTIETTRLSWPAIP
jgi:hypothetical protein